MSDGMRAGSGWSTGSDRPGHSFSASPLSTRYISPENVSNNSGDAIRPTTANSTGSVEYGYVRAVTIQNPRSSVLTLTQTSGSPSHTRPSFLNRFSTFTFLRELFQFLVVTFIPAVGSWGYFSGQIRVGEDGCEAKFLGTVYNRYACLAVAYWT